MLTVILLSYLNKKTNINLSTIAKFKLETLNKVQADTLNSKDKFELLVQETTKFSKQISEDSSHNREVIYYLVGMVVLFILGELIFSIMEKRLLKHKNQN